MSKYTTELRFICEAYAGLSESEGYNSINTIIDKSWKKIFDFNFPIFDEAYRKTLCTHIIKHFYTREICAETVGRWKLFLDSKLNLIMDKYNKLYKINVTEFNPLYDVDYTRTYKKGNVGTQKNDGETNVVAQDDNTSNDDTTRNVTGTTSGNSTSSYSDTPQGALTGLQTNTYVTNATIGSSTGTSGTSETSNTKNNSKSNSIEKGTAKNTIDVNNLEDYTERVIGKNSNITYGTMIKDFASSMIDVDCMIIKELEPLFMGIY